MSEQVLRERVAAAIAKADSGVIEVEADPGWMAWQESSELRKGYYRHLAGAAIKEMHSASHANGEQEDQP